MPHCELVEQGFAPGGITWQLLERQYSPVWQSEFAVQLSAHVPFTQALPALQSFEVLHVGSGWHVPLLQPHDL